MPPKRTRGSADAEEDPRQAFANMANAMVTTYNNLEKKHSDLVLDNDLMRQQHDAAVSTNIRLERELKELKDLVEKKDEAIIAYGVKSKESTDRIQKLTADVSEKDKEIRALRGLVSNHDAMIMDIQTENLLLKRKNDVLTRTDDELRGMFNDNESSLRVELQALRERVQVAERLEAERLSRELKCQDLALSGAKLVEAVEKLMGKTCLDPVTRTFIADPVMVTMENHTARLYDKKSLENLLKQTGGATDPETRLEMNSEYYPVFPTRNNEETRDAVTKLRACVKNFADLSDAVGTGSRHAAEIRNAFSSFESTVAVEPSKTFDEILQEHRQLQQVRERHASFHARQAMMDNDLAAFGGLPMHDSDHSPGASIDLSRD